MDDQERLRRFTGIAYLNISEGRDDASVRAILLDRGAGEEDASNAISEAHRHLREVAAYRNNELLKYVAGGIALIVVGYLLIPRAAEAAGRFHGMPYLIILLGIAAIGFGFWSRQLPR